VSLSLHWIRKGIGFFVLALMLGYSLHLYNIDLVSRLENIVYDDKIRLTMPNTPGDSVVIVDIDEKSLAEQGHWPWGRDKLANLIDRVFDGGAAVLGFDVVFAESDNSSGLASLEQLSRGKLQDDSLFQSELERMRPQLDNDARFAAAIKRHKVVLGYTFADAANSVRTGILPPPVLTARDFATAPPAYGHPSYNGNLARFQSVAAGGHFTPLVDVDGIVRRVPMLLEYQDGYYESLSLAMVRALLDFPKVAPGYDGSKAVAWLSLQSDDGADLMQIPVDEHLTALVPYRGKAYSFPYVSATDVLNGRVPADTFKNRLVLVGATAPGLLDLRATPVDAVYPGVEVHANLIAGILDGMMKLKPDYVYGIDRLSLLVVGLLMILVLPRFSPVMATVLTWGLVFCIVGLNLVLWSAGILAPVADALILIGILYAVNMSWGFLIESRSKRQFTALFGQYVPPELVDEMAKNPTRYSMEGRRAELTVLFSDVRGFTTISEALQPEELAALMNEYLGAMTEIVQRHRGTLDKYIGDAIMAFWGAPIADAAHAKNAVQAALDMQARLVTLNEALVAKGWPKLAIGVGVNSGPMTVGDMGSPVRKSYTVMGDAVNLGSRLESITKQYGVGIIVGEETFALLEGQFEFRELDRVRVKGKDAPVGIYEPLGQVDALTPAEVTELQQWRAALQFYRAQAWEAAHNTLQVLQSTTPTYLYELYIERIAHYRATPPGVDWDGVTTFETK
jgi:adenylate cyclase